MVGYVWRCGACAQSNLAESSKCEKCGCPAGASGDTTDKHRDSEGYAKKKNEHKLNRAIMHIVVVPIFIMGGIYRGDFHLGGIMLVSLASIIWADKALIAVITENNWALKIITSWFFVNVSSFGYRLYLGDSISDFVLSAFILGWLIYFVTMMFVLFKSKKGKRFIDEYKRYNESL